MPLKKIGAFKIVSCDFTGNHGGARVGSETYETVAAARAEILAIERGYVGDPDAYNTVNHYLIVEVVDAVRVSGTDKLRLIPVRDV